MALTSLDALTISIDPDQWRDVASCRDTDPDLFFPVGTTGPAIEQIGFHLSSERFNTRASHIQRCPRQPRKFLLLYGEEEWGRIYRACCPKAFVRQIRRWFW